MSLQQLLQGYSQEIAANTQHQNEMMDNVRDRKANTLEEQFNHHLEMINSAATELGTASGAIHLGRKIYKKYQANEAKRAKLQKAKEEGQSDAGADDSTPSGSQKPPQAPSGENGDTPRAGAEPAAGEPKPPTRTAAQASENGGADEGNTGGGEAEGAAGEAEEGAQETGGLSQRVSAAQERFRQLKARVGGGDAQPASGDTVGERADSAQERFQRLKQRVQGNAAADEPAAQPTTQSTGTAEPESADAPTGETAPQAPAEPQGDLGRSIASERPQATLGTREIEEPDLQTVLRGDSADPFSSPRQLSRTQGVRPAPEDTGENIRPPDAGPRPTAGGTEASGAEIGGEGGEEGATLLSRGAQRVTGLASDAANLVKSGAKQAASKVGQTLGVDGLAEGLETAGSFALDAIPVVGEVASVITGLVALFKGLDHKSDPDKEDAGAQAVAGPVSAGIDPSSLMKSSPAQATIV